MSVVHGKEGRGPVPLIPHSFLLLFKTKYLMKINQTTRRAGARAESVLCAGRRGAAAAPRTIHTK